jgi:hypothetical protein
MTRWLRRIFRRRYRLPRHVTEHRFRPGMAMVWAHVREVTPRCK